MSVIVKCPKKPKPKCKIVINRSNCWPPCPPCPAPCPPSCPPPCQQVSCGSCPTTALVRCTMVQGGVAWNAIASVPCIPVQPSCCPSPKIYYCPANDCH